MPHDLTKQIENHLATFPERHNDVLEMKKEWSELKGKLLWIVVGFVGSILSIGIWVGSIQTNIQHINELAGRAASQADNTDKRLNALEINNGEIKAKLAGIEATLQEIKVAIRQLNY